MTGPRVLILGAKPSLLEKASKLGLDVVNVQKRTAFEPDAVNHASEIHLTDYQDIPSVTALVRALHSVNPFTRVFTQTEAAQVVAAHLSETLGLPGNSLHTVRTVHDKAALRRLLNDHGLGAVHAEDGGSREDLRRFVSEHGGAVVKPRMGSGSLGVRKITGVDEVDDAWRWIEKFGLRDFLVEELMTGTEISVETFSVAGQHHVIAVTGKETGGGVVELGHIVPAALPAQEVADASGLTVEMLAAAGVVDGPAHTEIMITPDGPRVIESHTRRGGDRINELVEIVEGVDMEELTFRLALPEPLIVPDRMPSRSAAAIRYLTCTPGVVRSVQGVDEVAAQDDVLTVKMQVRDGDPVNDLRWSEDRCGFFIVSGTDSRTVSARAAELASGIRIETDGAPPQSTATLRSLLAEVDEVLDPFAGRT